MSREPDMPEDEDTGDLFGRTLFVDLLMNSNIMFVVALVFAVVVATAAAQPDQKPSVFSTFGDYVLIVNWPDESLDDVDLYIRDPFRRVVYWNGKEVNLIHLEHDDKGLMGDTVSLNGKSYELTKNEEHAFIRKAVPGEYVVNVHMFRKFSKGSVPVRVQLVSLKGNGEKLYERTVNLDGQGAEDTAFRFTLGEDGSVASFGNQLELFVDDKSKGSGGMGY